MASARPKMIFCFRSAWEESTGRVACCTEYFSTSSSIIGRTVCNAIHSRGRGHC